MPLVPVSVRAGQRRCWPVTGTRRCPMSSDVRALRWDIPSRLPPPPGAVSAAVCWTRSIAFTSMTWRRHPMTRPPALTDASPVLPGIVGGRPRCRCSPLTGSQRSRPLMSLPRWSSRWMGAGLVRRRRLELPGWRTGRVPAEWPRRPCDWWRHVSASARPRPRPRRGGRCGRLWSAAARAKTNRRACGLFDWRL